MLTNTSLTIAIIIMAFITFSQKLLPFIVLDSFKDSKVISHLSFYLPPSIMLVLTFYALKIEWVGFSYMSLPSILAALFTGAIHILWRQTLFSLGAGVAMYALLKAFLL
jgi:branched-subunit amino acid transport protein AzlD